MKFKRNKLDFDDNAFSTLTEKSCYWAGFIAADGCIIENRRVQIKLKHTDKEQLQLFKKFTKFNGVIRTYNNGDKTNNKHCYIKLTSPKMVKDLANNFNIVPRKSLILTFPKLSNTSHRLAFIRGYFDGDGSFYKIKKRNIYGIKFLGTKSFIKKIKVYLQKDLHLDLKKNSVIKQGNIFRLEYQGKKAIETMRLLYNFYPSFLEESNMKKWKTYYKSNGTYQDVIQDIYDSFNPNFRSEEAWECGHR